MYLYRSLACLLVLAPLLTAGPSMKERLAALRSKHGKAPAQDPRWAVGFDAEDAAFVRKFERDFPSARGPWVSATSLKKGDWIVMANQGAKVYEGVEDNGVGPAVEYGASANEFGRTRYLLQDWKRDRWKQTCCIREVKAGPNGTPLRLVRMLYPESAMVAGALKGREARRKQSAANQAYNQAMAEKRAEESRRRHARDAEMAAYRKRVEAQQALVRPPAASRPTYVPPTSSSTYRPPSSGLSPVYKPSSPRPGTQAWHDDRKITNPISYYQNKY